MGGAEGDGDIFNPDNQAAFIQFVKENTDGKGVHFVMADGVRIDKCIYMYSLRSNVFYTF